MNRATLVILSFVGVSPLAQDPDSNLLRSLIKPVQQLPVDRVELKTSPPVKDVAADDDMRPEYDFSGGVRGKYYERFRQNSNIVVLDADVSQAFPNSASVNQALCTLASVARRSVVRRSSSPTRRPNKQRTRPEQAKKPRR